ncbi:MAG: SCO1664 family protein [Nocardioidaceae bacterium]
MIQSGIEPGAIEDLLTVGSLELEGRLVLASNASFFGRVTLDGLSMSCIYKPVAGERPLWDFPEGSLAARERAARVVSEAGGWHVVPPTFLRDGRFGPGMVQQWIDVDPDARLVDVVPEPAEPGWVPVLEAEDQRGDPVLLVHADDDRLRDLAMLDVVINNADRKGGHVLPDAAGHVWGCDHGVTFHDESKLRTVLWGWADDPLRDEDVRALRRLKRGLGGALGEELGPLLRRHEVRALRARVDTMLERRTMPSPGRSWHAIPWPAM